MSNPSVLTLSQGKIGGYNVRIEDNLGEAIHVHIGPFTTYFTYSEFLDFSDALRDAASELCSLNNIDLSQFDLTGFDWDWIHRYKQIESIEIIKVPISALYTHNDVLYFGRPRKMYVKICDSYLYSYLDNKTGIVENKNEYNVYGITSQQRMKSIQEVISKNGYPFDNKYIVINQYGLIYDGAHRAVCLQKMYGKDYVIPVIQITFSDDKDINKLNKIDLIYYITKSLKYKAKTWIQGLKINRKAVSGSSFPVYSKKTFFSLLYKNHIRFYLIDKPKKDNDNVMLSNCTLIIHKDDYKKATECFNLAGIELKQADQYRNYHLLYSMRPILSCIIEDKVVFISDKPFIKSKFEDAILPLDQFIDSYIWDSLILSSDSDYNELSKICYLLLHIIEPLIEQNQYYDDDRIYIESNKELLLCVDLKRMLEKEVFSYSSELLTLLNDSEYDKAFKHYLQNKEYLK